MGTLVSNGSKLYQRSNSLVRSPIRIAINPDSVAYFSLNDHWNSSNHPFGGFWGSFTEASVSRAGQSMRDCWYNPLNFNNPSASKRQIWRVQETSHSPENIFYMGRWAISSPIDQNKGEAYLQLAAYHFTLPETTGDLSGFSLQITHGGEICAYQNPNYTSVSRKNFFGVNWRSEGVSTWSEEFENTGWGESTWGHRIGCFNQIIPYTPAQLFDMAQDAVELNSGLTNGSPTGYRRVWTGIEFGCIPVASIPYTQTYPLSDSIKASLLTNGGGWIITLPTVDDDVPSFGCRNVNYWMCESHWGYVLNAEIG